MNKSYGVQELENKQEDPFAVRGRKTAKLVAKIAKPVALTHRLVVGLGIGSVGSGNLRLERLQTLPQH
jgi:hypothetical protein